MISYSAATYTENENTSFKDKYGDLMLQIGFNIYLDWP
jgi:hypothetical protein